MKSKDFTPLIMGLGLLAGIIILSFIRSSRMIGVWSEYPVNFDIIVISSYILWMLIELRISRRDAHTGGKKTFDIEGYAEIAKKRKRLFPAVWQQT